MILIDFWEFTTRKKSSSSEVSKYFRDKETGLSYWRNTEEPPENSFGLGAVRYRKIKYLQLLSAWTCQGNERSDDTSLKFKQVLFRSAVY